MSVDARAMTRKPVVDSRCNRPVRYPRYCSKTLGSRVWDTDGNEYIDYLLGYGAVILGHRDPIVEGAAVDQLRRVGCASPLWTDRQPELARLLSEVVPGAEMSLLMKTGSDATSAAVRVARIYSGKERVIRWGYNGWHDWSVPKPAGVPQQVRELTTTFDYSIADLRRQFEEAGPAEVACVLMMPFETQEVPSEHLARVRDVAHSYGALFVLDEMRSGFRMAVGGAQEHFGIEADMSTFSKAMANGFAISALTGRQELLEKVAKTKISSTFFASAFEMAAAIACIERLRDTDAIEAIWSLGSRLQAGLREVLAGSFVRAKVVGYPPMPFIEFEAAGPYSSSHIAHRFCELVSARGILLHPDHHWFVSAAHSETDIDRTIEECAVALEQTGQMIHDG